MNHNILRFIAALLLITLHVSELRLLASVAALILQPSEAYAAGGSPSLTQRLCSQDINGDGDVASAGEIANCVQTPQGEFCPVGAANCTNTNPTNCPPGTAYNPDVGKCQVVPGTNCPDGFTKDPDNPRCLKGPGCMEPGIYDPIRDICRQNMPESCPEGFSWIDSRKSCEKDPVCPSGGAPNFQTGRCEGSTTQCPTGYQIDPWRTTVCMKTPACSSGSYNTINKRCEDYPQVTCPGGYAENQIARTCQKDPLCTDGALDSARNVCQAAVSCTGGTWNSTAEACVAPGPVCNAPYIWDAGSGTCRAAAMCPSGYSYVSERGRCELAPPTCDQGATYNAQLHACTVDPIATCPIGFTMTTGVCTAMPTCSDGGVFNSATQSCEISLSGNCATGYTRQGTLCVGPNACPAPSLASPVVGKCTIGFAALCANGYAPEASSGSCTSAAYCPSPSTLDTGFDLCTLANPPVCPPETTLDGNNICASDPACAHGGTPITAENLCVLPVPLKYTCPINGQVSNNALTCKNACVQVAGCNVQINYTCHVWATYGNWDPGECWGSPGSWCTMVQWLDGKEIEVRTFHFDAYCGTAEFFCPPGSQCGWIANGSTPYATYICPLPNGGACGGNPITCATPPTDCNSSPDVCPSGYTFSAANNRCEAQLATYTCPLGAQYQCKNNGGIVQCSPNTCYDPSGGTITEVPLTPLPGEVNDGAIDANGNCLDKIRIFSGKALRCRPPGLSVGLLVDCCEKSDKKPMQDNIGKLSQIQNIYKAGKFAYEAADVAMTASAFLEAGVTEFSVVDGTIQGVAAGGEVMMETMSSAEAAGAVAAGIEAGSAIEGVLAFAEAVLLNPATIAIAVIGYVVMKVLFKGCSQEDLQAVMQDSSKQCHTIGTFCQKKSSIVGCTQKAKTFCCFNSKLARIVHEQCRDQIPRYQLINLWGTPENPDCTGFTPEEFQTLDFSNVDMSEYFDELKTKAEAQIQTDVQNKVQQYYEKIRR